MLNTDRIRKDFPILKRKVHGKQLVYLDNAATTQKPKSVIGALNDYYHMYNANIHRGLHVLAEEATEEYEKSREKAADFINAVKEEIVFTRGTTESLNLAAYSILPKLDKGDEIIITEMEHHSNFVPWQQLGKRYGLKLRFIPITKDGRLHIEAYKKLISKRTKIVSVTHVSNVLGTINPIKQIGEIAHDKGALFIVDGAQGVPHGPVDAKNIGCDLLAFSGHKMLGPTGIGALYGKKEILEKMDPFLYGGEMIKDVTFENTIFNDIPWKFEAGTMNIGGAIAFGAAVDYLKKIGMEDILMHEKELARYAMKRLYEEKDVEIYGPDAKYRAGVVSFNLKNVHAHDVAAIVDHEGIAIRSGHHCAKPLMSVLGIKSSARASFYMYNTKAEIDKLIDALGKVRKVFA